MSSHKGLLAISIILSCPSGLKAQPDKLPLEHSQPGWQELLQQGKRLQQAEDYAAALSAYTLALAQNPHSTVILRLRAECLQYLGKFAEARADLIQGLHLEPDNASLYEGLGWLELTEGNYLQAQRLLKQALQLEPGNPWARINLEHSQLLQGYPELALSSWRPLLGTKLAGKSLTELLAKDFSRFESWGVPPEKLARARQLLTVWMP